MKERLTVPEDSNLCRCNTSLSAVCPPQMVKTTRGLRLQTNKQTNKQTWGEMSKLAEDRDAFRRGIGGLCSSGDSVISLQRRQAE